MFLSVANAQLKVAAKMQIELGIGAITQAYRARALSELP